MPSRRRAVSSSAIVVALLVIAGAIPVSQCQGGGVNETLPASPTSTAFLLQYIDGLIANLTATFEPLVKQHLGFCISDPHQDINAAFNFSIDQTFLVQCAANTSDLTNRICTAAEIKSYFSSFFASRGAITYLEPNKNCNFNTWAVGCEPGWSCRIGTNQNLSYIDSETIPSRIDNCEPVCEGFFSPYGITCMIPCPLGAYCPRATLNESTGACDPYNYQPSPGIRNHTCGGANIWADVQSSGNIFCPEGYYCPSTIQKKPCEDGYYCRKGSTYEASCFKSSSCKPKSANQDIKLFGGLVMVALSLLLVIIYNFHNQIITIREKKQAKSRESAMKTVREAVLARQRWKAARIAAISRAYGLRNQISRKFSRNWTSKQTELATIHGQNNNILDEYINDDEEERILRNRNHSSEVNSDFFEVILENSIENNSKKDIPKGKHKRIRTQIFKYAYDQIEKEKVMQEENKNLTFSGVVTMATEKEIRSRPLVEVAFKDLTLILKRNKKTLLRCVTGKLKPGHITAVMGPSGAGKTTFLTAIAGKTAGCDVTGLVLINGKVEPIQSYKKIIGFVPQDDIVHGNLTVEENIWFSARCRLSADMPKADKVLVVERTIESLGLQAVRNSLVGTVEKRGISGGQRKRVNVGLEMVMEPSLLILDEPTSGLDSSSSLLLLRALRREALEGVNICLVVHQPSYTLFNMFDELVLLAKGGFIVYHGPVKTVEDYFAGLGIHVPDRVNPPDHFIDILEGIVKPGSSISVTYNQLPIIWMLHNGYEIPQDMQKDLESVDASLREGGTSFARLVVDQHSGSSETWENFKGALDEKRHRLLFNFSRSKDLTNRKTPGILMQYKLYLGRIIKQRLREARIQVIDLLILCLAGVCLGLLAKINDETLGVAGYSYTTIAVSLLCKIASLRSFSLEKLQFIRERASGMSSLAYFLAKDTVDHFNTIVKPIVYLSMFYFLNAPRSTFTDNYIVLIALVYCVSGIGYTFAICFQPGSAQLWGALLPVVLTLISTRPNVSDILRNFCYPKWVLEAFVVANARKYPGVWLITRCGLLMKAGYNINDWGLCIAILFLYGFVFRLIAFICLVILQKK